MELFRLLASKSGIPDSKFLNLDSKSEHPDSKLPNVA